MAMLSFFLWQVHDIWGPFLVVAPASTLHNWQQEVTRFVPNFKVLKVSSVPYLSNCHFHRFFHALKSVLIIFKQSCNHSKYLVLICCLFDQVE